MEDFISVLMGASLLGLAKTDIKQQAEPVLPLSVEDRCMGLLSFFAQVALEREEAFIPVNQRACIYQFLEKLTLAFQRTNFERINE